MYSHPGEALPVHSVRSLTPRLVEARWPWGSGDLPLTSTFSAGEKKKHFFLFLKGWPESLTVWYFGFGAVFYFSNYLWSGWIGPLVPTEIPSDWSGWPQTKSHTIDHCNFDQQAKQPVTFAPEGRKGLSARSSSFSTPQHLERQRPWEQLVCDLSGIAMLILWVRMLIGILNI